jgi:hypothetical protein
MDEEETEECSLTRVFDIRQAERVHESTSPRSINMPLMPAEPGCTPAPATPDAIQFHHKVPCGMWERPTPIPRKHHPRPSFPILFITFSVSLRSFPPLLVLFLWTSWRFTGCPADKVIAGIAVRLRILVIGFAAFGCRLGRPSS